MTNQVNNAAIMAVNDGHIVISFSRTLSYKRETLVATSLVVCFAVSLLVRVANVNTVPPKRDLNTKRRKSDRRVPALLKFRSRSFSPFSTVRYMYPNYTCSQPVSKMRVERSFCFSVLLISSRVLSDDRFCLFFPLFNK